MQSLRQDVEYAARRLARAPGFTLVAVATWPSASARTARSSACFTPCFSDHVRSRSPIRPGDPPRCRAGGELGRAGELGV